VTERKQKYKKLQSIVIRLQETLKNELNAKTQYINKANEYKELIKDLRAQLDKKSEELSNVAQPKVGATEISPADKAALSELEAKNAELAKQLESCQNNLAEQKKKNEIQSKQLSMYVEELRKNCTLNIDMKNRLEEVIKEKETLLQSNETYKVMNETLKKEQDDFSEQVKKNFTREAEYKKSIQELESKIVKPDTVAYVYNMKTETVFGMEDIQVS